MQAQATRNHKILLLGGVLIDRCVQVAHYPEAGHDATIERSFDRVGGCAVNVAITLQNLGSTPYVVSRLGDDETGLKIEQYFASLPLPTSFISRKAGGKTGYCIAVIDGSGQRTFFTEKGCETEFPNDILAISEGCAFHSIYITGYYLLNSVTAAQAIKFVEHKRQERCQVFFDPGPLVGSIMVSQLKKMISLSDWMIPNSTEMEVIAGMIGCGDDPITALQKQGCENIIVKKGEHGADVYTNDNKFTAQGFRVNPIDTNGAGDSFAGGLIHALAEGLSVNHAVEIASACGAITSTIEGSHGAFTSIEIENLLTTQRINI